MRRPLRRSLVAAATALALAMGGASHAGGADASLSRDEEARLVRGDDVVRPQTIERGSARYVGGVAYVVVTAPSDVVAATVADPEAMREILPRTRWVKPAGMAGGDALYDLHQGTSFVHAEYTLRVRHEPDARRMRFWLERSRPHAIDDAWGYFRWEPITTPRGPAVLVTYGILVDVGPGVVRSLYEERLRTMVLTVPRRLREYLERPARAGRS